MTEPDAPVEAQNDPTKTVEQTTEVTPAPDAVDAEGNPTAPPAEEDTAVPGEEPPAPAEEFPSAEAGQTPIELASAIEPAPEGDEPNPDANTPTEVTDVVPAPVLDDAPDGFGRVGSILSQDAPVAEDPEPTEQSLRVLAAMDNVVRVTL